jgi:hypothetical protein
MKLLVTERPEMLGYSIIELFGFKRFFPKRKRPRFTTIQKSGKIVLYALIISVLEGGLSESQQQTVVRKNTHKATG